MKMPKYLKASKVYFKNGKAYCNIKIKWWGFPILYFKTLKKFYDVNFFGWIFAIIMLPKIWLSCKKVSA